MTTPPLHLHSATATLTDRSLPLVRHSHHYHAALLRALYEAQDIDPDAVLRAAVAVCDQPDLPRSDAEFPNEATESAARLFGSWGLGTLDVTGVTESGGGTVLLRQSHSVLAWRMRYPASEVCICGIASALLERVLPCADGWSLRVREVSCAATGAAHCTFEVTPVAEARADGRTERVQAPWELPPVLPSADGNAAEGSAAVDAPGVDLAASGSPFIDLPTEFYAAFSHLFTREIPRLRGAKYGNLPGILLLEAAHRNGFHLFGGVLASEKWRLARPELRGERDRLEMLLAIPAGLGWGSWQIHSFVPGERLIVRIPDSYEAAGHARLYGRSGTARCTVAGGAAAAAMNLLYRRAEGLEGALAPSDYNALFRSPHSFRAVETRCRAHGDAICELVVNPLTM